ncbi:hypothetical protein Pmani_008436 [Petrolisthes manimaculis]|uniref:Uncharacterized protein n=1 Tax=Petrolisthes manimaculis TaxID=1843537 RepID=A0AAE1Q5M6_9EUCA|nr:hypothetical protein Pmani_008436 [Petrolisthes manimaculis]
MLHPAPPCPPPSQLLPPSWTVTTRDITITPPLHHPGTPDTHITTVNHIASQPTSPTPTQPTHSPDTHTIIQPTSSIPRRPPSSSSPPNPRTKTQGGPGEESKVEEERDDHGEEQIADEMGDNWEGVRRGESGMEKEVKETNEGELKEEFGKDTESDKDESIQDTCIHPVDKTVKNLSSIKFNNFSKEPDSRGRDEGQQSGGSHQPGTPQSNIQLPGQIVPGTCPG